MIDYDKLKHAHELAQEYSNTKQVITIAHTFWSDDSAAYALLHGTDSDAEEIGDYNIDGLISKLEEMTKPEPKFALNSVAYALDGFNGIIEVTIHHTYITSTHTAMKIYVSNRGAKYAESELYPTREALVEAQVEYWQKVRCQGGGHAYDTDSSICLYCDTIKHSQPTVTIKGGTLALSEFDTVKVRGVERAVTEFDSCTHERDESKGRKLMYTPSEMGWVYVYPCKHCGEFFLDAMV